MEPMLQYLQHGKPVIVINTHHHWDHVWGNAVFGNSLVIAHSLCRRRLEERWEDMIQKNRDYISGEAQKCLPSLVFDDGLYFPDDGIRLLYTPGHTADSISVLDEKDGVLNAGDNVGDDMEHIVPNLECDASDYLKTLRLYAGLDADTVVSGHNKVMGSEVFHQISESMQAQC
jgi:glyoxylase-like metal-dependent hydrolase (beta-lactamase superfamily II)